MSCSRAASDQTAALVTPNAVLIRGAGNVTLSGDVGTAMTTSVLVNDAPAGTNIISIPTVNIGAVMNATVNTGSTLDIRGIVAGTALTKAGPGTLKLSGTSTTISASPTGATETGTTVTITTTVNHNLVTGQLVTIAGVARGRLQRHVHVVVGRGHHFHVHGSHRGPGPLRRRHGHRRQYLHRRHHRRRRPAHRGQDRRSGCQPGLAATINAGGSTGGVIIVDGGINVGDKALIINGLYGVQAGGAQLQSINGNNSWGTAATAITLGHASASVQTAISVDVGNTFTLYSTIGGTTGALLKVGLGTLSLSGTTGANTFAGNSAGGGGNARCKFSRARSTLLRVRRLRPLPAAMWLLTQVAASMLVAGLTTNLFPVPGLVAAFDSQIVNAAHPPPGRLHARPGWTLHRGQRH